ncbi:hypothetical protein SprV_0602131800 [Sparganum proliferum]
MENRWCQLKDTVQSTSLAALGRAHRQHLDWFDDSYAALSNLLSEKNHLHEAYVNHPIDDNKAAFYCSRRLVQQGCRRCGAPRRLARPRRSKVTRIATNGKISSPRSRLSTVCEPKQLLLSSAPMSVLCPLRGRKFCSDGPNISEASSTVPTISVATIARLLQVETYVDLDLLPSLLETIRVVQKLSNGKAPGSAAIPVAIINHGDP